MYSNNKGEKIIVFTDGGSRGNPGPAAIGVVIKDTKGRVMKSYGEKIGDATNNEAEYQALVSALKKVKALLGKEKCREVVVEANMDSELVMRQLNGKYKIEKENLFPYFIAVWNLKQDFKEVIFCHVPREKNQAADQKVNEALDKTQPSFF